MASATPVLSWAATICTNFGLAQSSSFIFTINITNAWQVKVPLNIRFPTNVSAGPQISVYRSEDGGLTYDTVAIQPLGLTRQSGGFQQVSLKLETGQYQILLLSGGGSTGTWTFSVLTQETLASILNA